MWKNSMVCALVSFMPEDYKKMAFFAINLGS